MPTKHRCYWVLLLLGLVLAGCPPDEGTSPPPFPSLDPAPSPSNPGGTPPPASGSTDSRSAAASGSQPGTASNGVQSSVSSPTPLPAAAPATQELARVCLMLPSAGAAKDDAAEMRRGMALAQARIGRESWRTRRIEWVERDTRSTEAGAVAAYHRCFNEGFSILIGPVHPAAVTALMPVAAAHDGIVLVPDVGAALPTSWGETTFAVAQPSTEMGHLGARHARIDLGHARAIVLHVGHVFGESLARSFKTTFEAEGGRVLSTRPLNPDKPQAWSRAAEELVKAHKADHIFVVGPAAPAEAVADLLDRQSFAAVHVTFIDWAMFPTVIRAAGQSKHRVHWVNRPPLAENFEGLFHARYQARPQFAAGVGYDAVILAAAAIESAPTLRNEDIRRALTGLRGLESAFGTGAVVNDRNMVWLDVAGFRIVQPMQEPESETWIFGGY